MALVIAGKAACVPSQLEDRISKGFGAVEIITFENQLNHSFRLMQRVLHDYADSLEFTSVHAPSELTISDATDEGYRKRGLSSLEKAITLASGINCERVVFHAFQSVSELGTINEMLSLRDKAFQKCVEGIRALEHLCEDSGVTLCLENANACFRFDQLFYLIFTASPNDLLRVVKEVNSNSLKLCFDVAHAQNACNFIVQNPEVKMLFNVEGLTPEGFCAQIIDYVDLIHFSDAKGTIAGKGTDNLPLGKGEVDFLKVLKVILAKGLRSPVVLEVDEDDINNAMNMVKSSEFLSSIITELKS